MIGMEISNYRILEKLGEGGMGVVYKALDKDLDRLVAIKVLSSEFSKNTELMGRFRAEARAQANLNHTNLATLYAFLVQEQNAFMVMEYIDGETFEQMIRRRGPIPEQETIPLFRQALLGLGYAHRAGIVHRDIKPSNLMLNKNGIVKVMDFGIVKVLGARSMTRTGTQMGTVAYMSPEQIQNRSVDIRSDIYELGVTLYEMLSGHLPFESDSDFEIMQAHVNVPPPSPSRFYPYISKGVEGVVLRAMEKNPDARFQTVEQFGAALEHPETLGGTPAAATAPVPSRATIVEGQIPPPAAHTPTVPLVSSGLPAGAALLQNQPAASVPAAAATAPMSVPAGKVASGPANKKWILVGAGALVLAILVVAVFQAVHSGAGVASGAGANTPQPSLSKVLNDSGPLSSTVNQSPAPSDSTPSSTEETPASGSSDATPPATNSAAPPASHPAGSGGRQITPAQMVQRAQSALAAHRYLTPVNDSAMYWAIQARKAGNANGQNLENQMQQAYKNQMAQYYQQKNYGAAISLIGIMLNYYPENPSLLRERQHLQGLQASNPQR